MQYCVGVNACEMVFVFQIMRPNLGLVFVADDGSRILSSNFFLVSPTAFAWNSLQLILRITNDVSVCITLRRDALVGLWAILRSFVQTGKPLPLKPLTNRTERHLPAKPPSDFGSRGITWYHACLTLSTGQTTLVQMSGHKQTPR